MIKKQNKHKKFVNKKVLIILGVVFLVLVLAFMFVKINNSLDKNVTGKSFAEPCENDDECDPGEYCNFEKGYCDIYKDCENDEECWVGREVCDENGHCVDKPCENSDDCDNYYDTCVDGKCRLKDCDPDDPNSCPDGGICFPNSCEAGNCCYRGECVHNGDCPDNYECEKGKCVPSAKYFCEDAGGSSGTDSDVYEPGYVFYLAGYDPQGNPLRGLMSDSCSGDQKGVYEGDCKPRHHYVYYYCKGGEMCWPDLAYTTYGGANTYYLAACGKTTCKDTDADAKNIYQTKGSATTYVNGEEYETLTDYCVSDVQVMEYQCTYGYPAANGCQVAYYVPGYHNCGEMFGIKYHCVNGACVYKP
ncbi:MAG: hypothetical protein WC796_02740 [Candidatus Pacearchaeota archaeon]|jgi:hypothetical protein